MIEISLLIAIVLTAILSGVLGGCIGSLRKNPETGVALGLFLGPVGCLFAFFVTDHRRKCLLCLGPIPDEAVRCQHCGEACAGERVIPQKLPTVSRSASPQFDTLAQYEAWKTQKGFRETKE